jgi:SAM-dependent methyltransferase
LANDYRDLYRSQLDQEAEWLRRGAAQKVTSIEVLLDRTDVPVDRLVELGCGTGAILEVCRDRGLARELLGVDYSDDALQRVRSMDGVRAVLGDITDPEFSLDGEFDVVVASHVIEHLQEPERFLEAVRRRIRAPYAVFEVPLEDLAVGRVRGLFRDRTRNRAGHVQFFTPRSFEDLLSRSGYEVLARHHYVPILSLDTVRFLAAKNGYGPLMRAVKPVLSNLLPRVFYHAWKHVYYAHYAVLCRPAPIGGSE